MESTARRKDQRLKELEARFVVLSVIESRPSIAVGKMARCIHTLLPDAVVMVGFWSLPSAGGARLIRKRTSTKRFEVPSSLVSRARPGFASRTDASLSDWESLNFQRDFNLSPNAS